MKHLIDQPTDDASLAEWQAHLDSVKQAMEDEPDSIILKMYADEAAEMIAKKKDSGPS